ncbi:MAG: MtfA peptidase [Thiomicrorhabdus sp.]|nr:MAG: MtfA peptidase [Thiomicrorhabdus sp.]
MNLTKKIRRYLLQRTMRRRKIPLKIWHMAIAKMPMMQRYNRDEKVRIRLVASEFLMRKSIVAIKGLTLTDEMRVTIAAQAAILLFGLENAEEDISLDWVHNWLQITIYPSAFYSGRDAVFNAQGTLVSLPGFESGETQYQSGIIIDWQDDAPHPLRKRANQVLLHEMAHKLDMLDGSTNGHPPLHSNMSDQEWYEVFSDAYNDLNHQLQQGHKPQINPYAGTNPAEFFAVSTEYFFEVPKVLNQAFPKVYHQLMIFYRQDPLSRELS